MRSSLFSSLLLAGAAIAAEVTYNWEATWVTAAPDGKPRPVIGINNAWPCPKIEANLGDTVIVNLRNRLGNQTTGLHFHGINQINTHFMDGPSGVTQCPVPPDSSITYKFVVSAYPSLPLRLSLTIPAHAVRRSRHILVYGLAQAPSGFRGERG